jgi:hypothetical protein
LAFPFWERPYQPPRNLYFRVLRPVLKLPINVLTIAARNLVAASKVLNAWMHALLHGRIVTATVATTPKWDQFADYQNANGNCTFDVS